jgi:acetyltransferase-like isoleucine patch superfamily enzyme
MTILKRIRKAVGKVRRFLRTLSRLNLYWTVVINFRTLPLKEAIHFPIFVFGKFVCHSLKGRFVLDAPQIRPGMIKLGYRWWDLWASSFLPTQLWLAGVCIFRGPCVVSGGVGLFVQRKTATLELGKNCAIGGGTFLKTVCSLTVGDNTQITGDCVVMDSNMHYVKNIETGKIARPWGKIVIGENCWINSGSIVVKGAILPNYTITARNSFLCKDYRSHGSPLFLVGAPATPKNCKLQRIFDAEKEQDLSSFFLSNDVEEFSDEPGLFVDKTIKI